jgi:hypothetical protein
VRLDTTTGGPRYFPLFSLDGRRTDEYDLSIGFRAWVWRKGLRLFANALVPLNDGGFRADVIPLIGVEATFGEAKPTTGGTPVEPPHC